MPLIQCPECGKQVSDKAASCPNCGRNFNTKKCQECGAEILPGATVCPSCGCPITVLDAAKDRVMSVVSKAGSTKGALGTVLGVIAMIGGILTFVYFFDVLSNLNELSEISGRSYGLFDSSSRYYDMIGGIQQLLQSLLGGLFYGFIAVILSMKSKDLGCNKSLRISAFTVSVAGVLLLFLCSAAIL